MPAEYAQFVAAVADAGLVSTDELQRAVTLLAAEQHSGDASELARLLVREGKLTKYQAAVAYQGKTDTLVLGNYIVLDKLGAGGMGRVYRAQHRMMDRVVAVKVLPKKSLSSPESVDASGVK